MVQGGGDVGPAGPAQEIGQSIVQRGFGMSALADPPLVGVFAPGDIADRMNLVFAVPVPASPTLQVGG